MLFRAVSLPFGELISLRKPLLMKPSITDTIYRSAMHYRQTDICWTMNGAAFLKENHFLVGLSLDGTKETNDMYRHASGCESVFDRIFQAANCWKSTEWILISLQ